jgi:hypothetical protein
MSTEDKPKNKSFEWNWSGGRKDDGEGSRPAALHISTPDGHSIDLTVGQMFGIAIVLTIIPFNWAIVGLVIAAAYFINQNKQAKRDQTSGKVKNDADDNFIDAA